MQNLVTFSEGTHILGTNFSSWEDRVEQNGNGIAQGIELFLQKKAHLQYSNKIILKFSIVEF